MPLGHMIQVGGDGEAAIEWRGDLDRSSPV
jgi:hypothetical protein